MQRQLEVPQERTPVVRKAFAGLVLVAVAALAVKVVIGMIMAVFWVVVTVAAVVAVLWALKTIVW